MKHDGGGVTLAEFSPDEQRVVTVSGDNTVRLWDALSGKQVGEPMKHEHRVDSVWFSPDGQRVLTVLEDNTVRLWDAFSGKQIGEPMIYEGKVHFSPDGQRVLTGTRRQHSATLGRF